MRLSRSCCLIAACAFFGTITSASAQNFAADQFLPLIPGITASVVQEVGPDTCSSGAGADAVSFACAALALSNGDPKRAGGVLDANGALYQVRQRPTTAQEHNWPIGYSGEMFEIERRTESGIEVVVQIPQVRLLCHYGINGGECVPGCGGGNLEQLTQPVHMMADPINGVLYFVVESSKVCGPVTFGSGYAVVKLSGLPTLLDIILSYQPPSTLSFNVPVRPEGLSGADSFSVYAGDVGTASDLSQATPLQCTVPEGRPPVAGEHLTVPDPLPDPAVGDARYYVAAVNYQGQRRAGRTSMQGVMQGRNAAALPECP